MPLRKRGDVPGFAATVLVRPALAVPATREEARALAEPAAARFRTVGAVQTGAQQVLKPHARRVGRQRRPRSVQPVRRPATGSFGALAGLSGPHSRL